MGCRPGRRIGDVREVLIEGRQPRQDLGQGRRPLDRFHDQAAILPVDHHFVHGQLELPRDADSLVAAVAKQARMADGDRRIRFISWHRSW